MKPETQKERSLEIYDRIVKASFNSKGEFDAEEFERRICDEIVNFYEYPYTKPLVMMNAIKFAVEAHVDFLRQQKLCYASGYEKFEKTEKDFFDLYRNCVR